MCSTVPIVVNTELTSKKKVFTEIKTTSYEKIQISKVLI